MMVDEMTQAYGAGQVVAERRWSEVWNDDSTTGQLHRFYYTTQTRASALIKAEIGRHTVRHSISTGWALYVIRATTEAVVGVCAGGHCPG